MKKATGIGSIVLGLAAFVVGALGVQGHDRQLEGIAFILLISTIVVYAVGMLAREKSQ